MRQRLKDIRKMLIIEKLEVVGHVYQNVGLTVGQYVHRTIFGQDVPAIELHLTNDGYITEPLATLSAFVVEAYLEPGEFPVKTYSENSGLLEQLVTAGVVEYTGTKAQNPHAVFPVARLSERAQNALRIGGEPRIFTAPEDTEIYGENK